VIHRLVTLVAWACCALICASFGLFAFNRLAGVSERQQLAAAGQAAPTSTASAAHHPKSQPRRFIDGAASELTQPFASIVQSHTPWADRGVPALLGLLVYGVGLGYLARYARRLD
jgi:hypothetical protein